MRAKLFDLHNTDAATVYIYPATQAGLDGHRTMLHLTGSGGVTYTIQATGDGRNETTATSNDPYPNDGSQLSANVWHDVTDTCPNLANGGATAASYVDTNALLDVSHLTAGRWRLKRVTSDATNDCRASIEYGPGTAMPGGGALPSGAATEATLATVHGHVDSIDTKLGGTAVVNTRSAIGTWTPATAAAPADSAVISAAACKIGRVMAVNSHASITYYLMLFDLAAVPADATAPRLPAIPLVPGQTVMLDLGGMTFATGLCWSDSTTVATKTIAATTPLQVSAEVL